MSIASLPCAVEDCETGQHAKGFCVTHYGRTLRHGDPLAGGRLIRRSRPTIEGFWAQVEKNGPIPEHRPELGPCWIWTGRPGKEGYGSARLPGFRQQMGSHRAAWYLTHGSFPELPHLDHLCRVRPCCNPAHLEPVTAAENNRRSRSPAALNQQKTRCKNGHEFTVANTRINADGSRTCRKCVAARARQYRRERAS